MQRIPFGFHPFRAAALLAVLFSITRIDAQAQSQLNFKRAVNNWPTIELYFSIGCNGQAAYVTDKQYLAVTENGVRIPDFSLQCPDPTTRCAISSALIFDASGSMDSAGNRGAKAAGNAFVDIMDGVTDEAAVIWFNQAVVTAQGMTAARDLLHSAVNNLPASGASAVWDGIYAGIAEVVATGVNQCRTAIVVTDGQDGSSTHQPADIIALATQNRVRVFTVGLGGSVSHGTLESIATLTGGRYYQTPNPDQLAAIYQEISTIILQSFQECMITYTATCMDGGVRTVDLSLVNFCGGSDTETKTYRAPRDTTTFAPLRIGIGSSTACAGHEAIVPLLLLDPITPESALHPATFAIRFDTTQLRFLDITAPAGTLLAGVPFLVAPDAGGVSIATTARVIVHAPQAPAVLAYLRFAAGLPGGADTARPSVTPANWNFAAGCFSPVLNGGEITVIPAPPVICTAAASDSVIPFDRVNHDYMKRLWTIQATLRNAGTTAITNVTARIALEDSSLAGYALLYPNPDPDNTDTKTLPLLTPNQEFSFLWQFKLGAPNMSGAPLYPRFTVTYGFAGAPCVLSSCSVPVEIEHVVLTGVDHAPAAASGPVLYPDPSHGSFTARIPADPGAAVRITAVDMLGREVLRVDDVSATTDYRASLRIAPAVPGTYYLFITSGGKRWIRSVRVF